MFSPSALVASDHLGFVSDPEPEPTASRAELSFRSSVDPNYFQLQYSAHLRLQSRHRKMIFRTLLWKNRSFGPRWSLASPNPVESFSCCFRTLNLWHFGHSRLFPEETGLGRGSEGGGEWRRSSLKVYSVSRKSPSVSKRSSCLKVSAISTSFRMLLR